MPDALEAAVRSLPVPMQDLPIVAGYLDEQAHRAVRCEQIAGKALRLARTRQIR